MLMFIAFLANILLIGADGNLSCYNCSDITHTYDCSTVQTCSSQEVCYIATSNEGDVPTYTQGCIPSHFCENSPGGGSIVGKRGVNRRQGSVEYGDFSCCFSNQCNQRHKSEVSGLVFRITPHIGGDVFQAWMNGTKCITADYCRNVHPNGCVEHYRNNVIDNWDNLNISVVKYALYKNDKEVAYIYFNATGSSMTNWFSQSRVINSTWIDLKNTTVNRFAIDAVFPVNRRFYINEEWNGCGNDRGWTVVVTGNHVCNFDHLNGNSYPYILYSKGNTYGHYDEFFQFGEADVAAVYIYY